MKESKRCTIHVFKSFSIPSEEVGDLPRSTACLQSVEKQWMLQSWFLLLSLLEAHNMNLLWRDNSYLSIRVISEIKSSSIKFGTGSPH